MSVARSFCRLSYITYRLQAGAGSPINLLYDSQGFVVITSRTLTPVCPHLLFQTSAPVTRRIPDVVPRVYSRVRDTATNRSMWNSYPSSYLLKFPSDRLRNSSQAISGG